MGELWKNVLARYGQTVTLRSPEGGQSVRAFFQPVEERGPGEVPTPLGIAPAGRYLYLGPAEIPLEGAEELVWEDRAFRILRHRAYLVEDQVVYRWALCEEQDTREGSV